MTRAGANDGGEARSVGPRPRLSDDYRIDPIVPDITLRHEAIVGTAYLVGRLARNAISRVMADSTDEYREFLIREEPYRYLLLLFLCCNNRIFFRYVLSCDFILT